MKSSMWSWLASMALLATIWLAVQSSILAAVAAGVAAVATIQLTLAAVRAERREQAKRQESMRRWLS